MVQFNQIITSIRNFFNGSKKNIFIVIFKLFLFNLAFVISYTNYSFDPIFNIPLSVISASVFLNIINNFSKYFEIYCSILQFSGEEICNFLSMTINNKLLQYYFYCFDYVKKSFAILISINIEDYNFCTWKLFSIQLNLFLISFFPLLVFIQYFTSEIVFVIFNIFAFLCIILYNKIGPIILKIINLFFSLIFVLFELLPKFLLLFSLTFSKHIC